MGLIGAGRIGTCHATLLTRHVPGAALVAVADPRPDAAQALATGFGCRAITDAAELFADPEIEAVVITASADAHAGLVVGAAAAGKAVFCEKPMGLTLAEVTRGIEAAEAAGVTLQIGFNRRFALDFAKSRRLVVAGEVGTPQLMRSLTRDPGLAKPRRRAPWTIFLQTLIHDFDTLLWLNPDAEPVGVFATADALVAPEFKDAGLLDTAVVVITFDNGAIAVAEASFSASYGYDVRAEVLGSRGWSAWATAPAPAWTPPTVAGTLTRSAATLRSSATPTSRSWSSSPMRCARAAPPRLLGRTRALPCPWPWPASSRLSGECR